MLPWYNSTWTSKEYKKRVFYIYLLKISGTLHSFGRAMFPSTMIFLFEEHFYYRKPAGNQFFKLVFLIMLILPSFLKGISLVIEYKIDRFFFPFQHFKDIIFIVFCLTTSLTIHLLWFVPVFLCILCVFLSLCFCWLILRFSLNHQF